MSAITTMKLPQLIKRSIDVALAAIILFASLPILVIVALLILILEGRPVFYVSRRMVSNGRSAPIYKFRTMVRDAKSSKYRLVERFMRDGYLDVPRTCEVYTPIGRWLERCQIVELPQMLNVLLHGMSLIGNRPLPEENVKLLRRYENWSWRFASPAGITGIAQVVGKLWLDPQDRLDLESSYSKLYQSGNILWCDLVILYYTLRFILTSKGLSPDKAFRLVGAPEGAARVARRYSVASMS